MEPVYAGILAWAIELFIAGAMILVLKREEEKVYKRRKRAKEEEVHSTEG
tara:strand:+ start:40 stop:189 length:150 start_codon:yes stop_codon:yes gene_type:complete